MNHSCFLILFMIAVIIAITCLLPSCKTALANEFYPCMIPIWYWLSMSNFNMPGSLLLIYLDSLCPDNYNLYFNSIGLNSLLGCSTYSPFLTKINSGLYNLLGIPTYPNLGLQYENTFPYTTLSSTIIPYTRFDYPSYVYGSPDFYLIWVLLQY